MRKALLVACFLSIFLNVYQTVRLAQEKYAAGYWQLMFVDAVDLAKRYKAMLSLCEPGIPGLKFEQKRKGSDTI